MRPRKHRHPTIVRLVVLAGEVSYEGTLHPRQPGRKQAEVHGSSAFISWSDLDDQIISLPCRLPFSLHKRTLAEGAYWAPPLDATFPSTTAKFQWVRIVDVNIVSQLLCFSFEVYVAVV